MYWPWIFYCRVSCCFYRYFRMHFFKIWPSPKCWVLCYFHRYFDYDFFKNLILTKMGKKVQSFQRGEELLIALDNHISIWFCFGQRSKLIYILLCRQFVRYIMVPELILLNDKQRHGFNLEMQYMCKLCNLVIST